MCPVAKITDIMGDACTVLIVRDLLTGPKRFGEISESLDAVSTRTIAVKLKSLEKSGFIFREVFSERPPRVQYSLTKKGAGLATVIASMRSYAEKYL